VVSSIFSVDLVIAFHFRLKYTESNAMLKTGKSEFISLKIAGFSEQS